MELPAVGAVGVQHPHASERVLINMQRKLGGLKVGSRHRSCLILGSIHLMVDGEIFT